MTVRYYLKDGKANRSLVFLVVWVNGSRWKLSTGIQVRTADWSKDKQKLKGSAKRKALNMALAELRSRAEDILFEHQGKSLSKAQFKKLLFQEGQTGRICPFFSSVVEDRKRSGQFSQGTIKVLQTALNKLQAFDQDLTWDDIDLDFFEQFTSWLFGQGFSTNYVNKIVVSLKTVLNIATEKGVNKNLAFRSRLFSVPKVETSAIYLGKEDLARIQGLQRLDPGVDNARKMFLLMAWTGLRYSDLAQADLDHVVWIQDKAHLKIHQVKTGGLVVVPLKSEALKIVKEGFQVISNQKANDHLKTLARLAGLEDPVVHVVKRGSRTEKVVKKKWELVSCHTGRRSFATNAFLAGVPVLAIMKITGHRTEKSFLKYIKIDLEENAVHVKDHPFFV